MNPCSDLFHRLHRSIGWVAAQYWATLLLVLAGAAWTRLPDKYWWQVALSLLVPFLLIVSLLELEAATMRAFADDDGKRVKLVWGAVSLAFWAALFWVAWLLLDWCDGQIPSWASYLNSRAPAHARAALFTYAHIQRWLTLAEWVLRWIVVPGKLILCALASAQWGWRLPWRKLIRLMLHWRWWPAVVLAALAAVELPSHFFTGFPHGAVSHQVWTVIFKLAGAYLLAVSSWVLLLAWAAVLFSRATPGVTPPGDDAFAPVPVHSGPLGEDSVRLPLPESGDDAGGNA